MSNENNTNLVNEEELEINLKDFFNKLISMWYYVFVGVLIGVLLATVYTAFLTSPKYASSSSIYLRGNSKSVSLSDLQLGTQLVNDYEFIIKGRNNMERVIDNLGLDTTADALANSIHISHGDDTRILTISVTTKDPYLSRDIVNEVVETGIKSIKDIDSQEPYVIERAVANGNAVNASVIKMAALGGMAGFVLSVGIIFLIFVFDDSINKAEDIESTLGIPVLGVVKYDQSLAYTKKVNQPKKKKTSKSKLGGK